MDWNVTISHNSLVNVFSRFGNTVRFLRESKGISQEVLADHAGLDRTYVSGIERGVRNPTLRVIEIFAKALDVEIRDLFVPPASQSDSRHK